MNGVQKMEQLNTMLGRLLLALCAVVLAGCGYGSSPGMVVETKKFPLNDNNTLIVTRHLDYWKTGNPFTFEWYVVKCRSAAGLETLLLQDFVLRGTFSSEIPEERIQIKDPQIGYVYFSDIVVFDKQCNQISHFDPWVTSAFEISKVTNPFRIEHLQIDPSGHGYANLSWAIRGGGMGALMLKTDDYGVHWALPTTGFSTNDGIRVTLPSLASFTSNREITKQLEKSEYVVTGGALTKRPEGVVSTSISLGRENEYRLLMHAVEIAKTRVMLENWVGILLSESKDDYEVTIGYSTLNKYHYYPYSTKILINKKSKVLANWLSGSKLQ